MPFQQWLLVAVPTWVTILVLFMVAIGTSVGGVLLVRRFFNVSNFKRHHDIAGPIFATLGVVYAVLLGFVLVIVWQNYEQTSDAVVAEANCYGAIYRDLGGLPDPFRSEARTALTRYVNSIIEDEWPLMALGQRSMKTQELSNAFWDCFNSFEPVTEREKIYYQELLHQKNQGSELRRARLAEAIAGINPALWFVLLLGGIITIAFTFFFGSDNIKAQMIMTTLLSLLIALILFTTASLDYPFSGDVSVTPHAFKQILLYLK